MEPRTIRILLVDDDEFVRELVVGQLTELGHRVLAVGDAEAALRAVEGGEPFDLLMTDVMLPGADDGYALAARIRALHPSMPVLYASGNAARPSAGAAAEPPVAFLQKPFRLRQLASAVDALAIGIAR